jgi:hypothetical protein
VHSDIGIFGFRKGQAKVYIGGKELKIVEEHRLCDIVKEMISKFRDSNPAFPSESH